ncbi:hypothetical protein [Streptomyces sp. L-9-10]|uniref:hypothetical protein n=1 Tax=Streptomyces sp. L-9-10 TaxID=1478131 RepID=UPI00101BDE4B|nr:hypothetical protein [Streptomyces sp. L-9-10]
MENISHKRSDAELELTGPVLTRARLIEGSVQRSYNAFIAHAQACIPCRAGVDCDEAATLRQSWRLAKDRAAS